jgi:hypothetical protein
MGWGDDPVVATPAAAPAAASWGNDPLVKTPETYLQAVGRTGKAVDVAAGPGMAGLARTGVGALEMAGSMASGVVGDVAGAGASLLTQNPQAGKDVRQALTYQPRTETGKAGMEYAGALAAPVSKVLSYVPQKLEKAGYPIAGQVATALTDVADVGALTKGAKGAVSGMKQAGSAVRQLPSTVSAAMTPRTVAQIVQDARASGYVLKPSEAGGTVGKYAEGLTGSPRLSIEATIKNQANTNRLVNQELGIPDTTKLTPQKIRELKAPHNDVYRQVGELGTVLTDENYLQDVVQIGRAPGKSFSKVKNPDIESLRDQYLEQRFDAKDAVLQIRKLRRDGGKNLKNQDPGKNELGYAQRQVADAIESQLERHAQLSGQTNLFEQFRNSRQQLAKINSVEDSLNVATGDISAPALAKAKKKGAPLSGNLKTIAEVHDAFPSEMRDAAKVRNKVPLTVVDALAGGIGGGLATMTQSPIGGAAALGAVAARPLARKILLSKAYQNTLSKGPAPAPAAQTLNNLPPSTP